MNPRRSWNTQLSWLHPVRWGLVLSLAGAGASVIAAPLTVERVAFTTGPNAAQPSVTAAAGTGFVLTWQQRDGKDSALWYALLDRAGSEIRRGLVSSGPERFVNSADFPNLAVLDNGDWVTFWLQKTASGTYAYEIRTTRSRDQGRTWDPPVVVHRDGTPTEHGFVSMAPAGEDRVRLVWLDGRQMAASADAHGEGGDEKMTLRTAVLSRDGAPTGERELDALTCACCQTDMVRSGKQTVAVYRDRTSEEIRDIGVVTFDAAGLAADTRVLHNDAWTMPACPVNGPALAVADGRFLAVWPTMAKGPMEVRAALGTGSAFEPPRTLGQGDLETGRVDAAAFGNGWLVSRVTTPERKPTLTLTVLSDDGTPSADQPVATPVGGYPRLAVEGDIALLVFTEPAGPGNSRVAVVRVH